LLYRLEHARGGADFVHPDGGEDEVEQLPHRQPSAGADQEQFGCEVQG
jgi:hypothetical protein